MTKSAKNELHDLWTSKSMELAKTIESNNETYAVRTAARVRFDAYADGLKALYLTGTLTAVKRRLQRKLRNPMRMPRHAVYVTMLHDLEVAADIELLAGGDSGES
ncbi:hypothetical protein AB0K52_22415 [Glycomyces sp. NPDC049804]|uniref:hypothetical protein n=1 Tax=Glycomyces sp. NPDC049804 TaxID=3154363 RepID=UPI003430A329